MDDFAQMREYISATEHMSSDEAPMETITETILPGPNSALLEDLRDIVFRLRAFTESSDIDGFGMELGMQRAADMIEHAIKRHYGD